MKCKGKRSNKSPYKAPSVAPAAPKLTKTTQGPSLKCGEPTGLKGYILIHTSELSPYGDVVGRGIPTTAGLAVKMAVADVILPRIDNLKDNRTKSDIQKAIRSKNWDKAVGIWTAYMQNVGLCRKTNEFAESLQIVEMDILSEP